MVNLILLGIALTLISALWIANRVTRRTQKAFTNRSKAAQLRRGASHMYKIACAAKTYALHDSIVRALLHETSRLLKLAVKLDPEHQPTRAVLLECDEMIVAFNASRESDANRAVEYPESILLLLDAQMHLTEASRLLNSMGKRGLITHELHQAITITLQYAQRALELRLNLRQVSLAQRLEHTPEVAPLQRRDYQQPKFAY